MHRRFDPCGGIRYGLYRALGLCPFNSLWASLAQSQPDAWRWISLVVCGLEAAGGTEGGLAKTVRLQGRIVPGEALTDHRSWPRTLVPMRATNVATEGT